MQPRMVDAQETSSLWNMVFVERGKPAATMLRARLFIAVAEAP